MPVRQHRPLLRTGRSPPRTWMRSTSETPLRVRTLSPVTGPCLYLAAASRQLSSWALSDPCKGFGLSRRWSFSGHSRKPKGLLGTEVGGSGE